MYPKHQTKNNEHLTNRQIVGKTFYNSPTCGQVARLVTQLLLQVQSPGSQIRKRNTEYDFEAKQNTPQRTPGSQI